MKHYLSLLAMLLTSSLFAQNASLSPLTRIFLSRMERQPGVLPDNYCYRQVASQIMVAGMISVTAAADEAGMRTLGVQVGTKAGNIWTVMIPVRKVDQLARLKGIEYLQLDEPLSPSLDVARVVTRVDSVHSGLGGLTMPYHGDNVVVGIIDAGFDYRHPTLFDTTGNRYRVKKIWEQTQSGTPPAGFSYGSEIADTLSMWGKGYDMDISHGTHVAGIAAGSGYGSLNNRQYRGMADAADLVLVGITPPATDWTTTGMSSIVDAMSYIYSYAAASGKSAVANLSWGCSIGSHDGLSLFSQACDNLTGPGKIFVLSAGNNGQNNIHVQKTFSSTDSLVRTFATFSPSLGVKKTWVDIWGDSSEHFCVQLSLYNGSGKVDSTGFFCLDNALHSTYIVSGNDTFFATVVTSSSEFNGKPRIFLDIYNKTAHDALVTVKGKSGTVNMWSGFVENTTGYYSDFTNNGFPWAVNGNNSMTVGDMATTKSALTVGAYISKPSFVNVSGSTVTYGLPASNGGIAGFSSRGPSADGRIKPDITGPGMVLGSAINSYDPTFLSTGGSYSSVAYKSVDPKNGREYAYAMLMGTSMSSPAVAGIVSLMLQAAPSLTPQQVKDALAQTAITDIKTGSLPAAGNNTWGHGKVNALGAVRRAMTITDVENAEEARLLEIYPNPASSQAVLAVACHTQQAAEITVYDLQGRNVWRATAQMQQGYNNINLNTAGWSRGVYMVRLRSNTMLQVARLVLQ